MKRNHLIIGLGGTGGKVIRSFVKTVKRNERPGVDLPVNLQYLYIDSSPELMASDDPTWKVLGENLQLKPANQLHLDGKQVAAMLADPFSYPGVKRWIGDPQQWRSVINLGSGATILGGQKRRLGRLLFAAKVRDFLTMVDGLVKELTNNNMAAVTIHICCGLAGGTGSGALIDVICQLRRKFPDDKILLYLLLPDRFPKQNWDTGNYHSNGYAALLELNALGAGLFQPFDITGNEEKVAVGAREDAPFNCCYLMTNENENGLVLDVDTDVPQTLAAFLYEKVVAAADLKYDNLDRHERFENQDPQPEGIGPEKQRCRKFIAFGINQLLYPEHEIMEFFTYSLADQAALQMLFNHWTNSSGYVAEPQAFDVHDFIAKRRPVWKLDIASIQLEQPVFGADVRSEEKFWRNIHDEWTDFVQRVRQDITSDESGNWVKTLGEQCLDRFQLHYRGVGVDNFFEEKKRSRAEYAREINRVIEADLISTWAAGTLGSVQVDSVIEALAEYLVDIARQSQESSDKARLGMDEREAKIHANYQEWQDVGPLSRLFKKHEEVFEAAASNFTSYYENRTIYAAASFAGDLVTQVRNGLMELKGQLQRFSARLQEVHETMQRRAAARCNDHGEDFDRQMVRMYNPGAVREVVKNFCSNLTIQSSQTANVRAEMLRRSDGGKVETLSGFGSQMVCDLLEASCSQAARDLHMQGSNELRENGDAILGLSIIDKLDQRYKGNPEKMRQEITRLVERSLSFVPFDESEVIKTKVTNLIRSLLILHPSAPDKSAFVKDLEDAFRNAWKSGGDGVQFIASQDASENRGHELTILSMASMFPLRFVRVLNILQEKYRQRMNSSDPKRAQLELHIEGDGTQHPALFIPTVVEQGLPLLILALGSGVVARDGGKFSFEVMQYDSQNRPTIPKRVSLGDSIKGYFDRLTEGTLMEDLITLTDKRLADKLEKRAATADEIRQSLINECQAIRPNDGTYEREMGLALNNAINRLGRIAEQVSSKS